MQNVRCPRCQNSEINANDNFCKICGLDLKSKKDTIDVLKQKLTPKEAAPLLNVSVWTLYDMVRKKQIPHFKVRSKIFFRKDVLEAWLIQQEMESFIPPESTFQTSHQFGSH